MCDKTHKAGKEAHKPIRNHIQQRPSMFNDNPESLLLKASWTQLCVASARVAFLVAYEQAWRIVHWITPRKSDSCIEWAPNGSARQIMSCKGWGERLGFIVCLTYILICLENIVFQMIMYLQRSTRPYKGKVFTCWDFHSWLSLNLSGAKRLSAPPLQDTICLAPLPPDK